MADECVFCNILAGKLKAERVGEDETVVAIHDIDPQAPTHILIVPKEHIGNLNDLTTGNADVMRALFLMAKRVAGELGLAESGYRVVFNCGPDAGMEVNHLHLHLLGGRRMKWPPG